jgi:hypothetical protein
MPLELGLEGNDSFAPPEDSSMRVGGAISFGLREMSALRHMVVESDPANAKRWLLGRKRL